MAIPGVKNTGYCHPKRARGGASARHPQFRDPQFRNCDVIVHLFLGPRIWNPQFFCCVFCACKRTENAAKHRKNTIFRKIGRSRHVDPWIFQKIIVLPGFCGGSCALPSTRYTAGKLGVSSPWARKRSTNASRTPKPLTLT